VRVIIRVIFVEKKKIENPMCETYERSLQVIITECKPYNRVTCKL
jgi:hypothetical protein